MNTQQSSASPEIWGMRHEAFLRQYQHSTYVTLLASGDLDDYLAGIDQCAAEMAEKLTERLIAERGITEALKQDEPVRWIQEMNSVKAAVREIVCAEIIDVG